MTKIVSIIVPVYNVDSYLEKCVFSLLEQNIAQDSYEIILVNDGSTDKSKQVAERLSSENDNVILINQDNQGLSGARNTGLSIAQGEFVMFVDSDDELFPNVLGDLCSLAYENDLDVCAYRMRYCDGHGRWHNGSVHPFSPQEIYTGEYAILHGADIGSACIYLYKNLFLKDHSLLFTTGIYHEDVDFNMRMYALAKKIIFSDVVAYKYNYNPKSIKRELSREKMLKSLKSEVFIARHINDFLQEQQFSSTLISFYKKHNNSVLVSVLLQMMGDCSLLRKDKLIIWDEMKEKSLYPIRGKTLSIKTTLVKYVLNVKPLCRMLLFYRT